VPLRGGVVGVVVGRVQIPLPHHRLVVGRVVAAGRTGGLPAEEVASAARRRVVVGVGAAGVVRVGARCL
jgi:hypothetical protein